LSSRLLAWRAKLGFRRIQRRGFFSSLAAVLFTASVGFAAPAASPQSASPARSQDLAKHLGLTYEVHAGGLHIFTFDVDLILEPQGYRITAAGGTQGVTSVLYKWDVKLAAEGERRRPERYVTVNSGRQPRKIMQLDFLKGGSFAVTRDPPEPAEGVAEEEKQLPASLPPNIVDPLSATLVASRHLVETGRCEQTIPVFDGKRRYNLLIRDAGTGQVPKSRISVYHGPATLCGFTMERISGFKKKRRYTNQWDEDKDEPPKLWIAKVREDMPPVPVRFTGAVALGSIIVHLTRIEPGPEVAGAPP
jgi:hypothetical protein